MLFPQIWEKQRSACGGVYQLDMLRNADSGQKYSIYTLMVQGLECHKPWFSKGSIKLQFDNMGFLTLLWKLESRVFQLDTFKHLNWE